MKKAHIIILLAFLSVQLIAQGIQHEVVTVNIEVPVRVFKGDTFIDNLTLTDFELYENGVLQNIEAVYLIKKRSVEKREEENRRFSPSVSRFYALIFILTDFLPRVNEAVDYFFQEVFLPGDTLSIATPMKSYNLRPDAISRLSREDLKNQLIQIIRRDVQLGNIEYKRVIRELRGFAQEEDDLNYLTTLQRLDQLRYVDQDALENFAKYLKLLEGQKNVFLFYQQELIPQLAVDVGPVANPADDLNWLLPGSKNPFPNEFFKDISFDAQRIERLFSDSSISMHFLYVKNHLRSDIDSFPSLSEIKTVEESGDVFKAFRDMAATTGGTSEITSNILNGFKKAVDASENYYLLYYTPKNYSGDGSFNRIVVHVKPKGYSITHRAGYFSN